MTNLVFLGSGSAFTVGADNFQSNMFLVSDRGKKLLLDCGSDIRFSLHEAGFSHLDITDIYISHLHSDHVGGLEFVGLATKFDPRCKKPNLYLSKDLAGDLWERTLSGGMKSIGGDIAELETFFKVHKIEQHNRYFYWENIKFYLVQVVHVHNGYYLMPSYGLFFEVDGIKVFITTDTQFCPDRFRDIYKKAELIFQDCETSKNPTNVHAHYQYLATLPEKIKNKMWLYGYQPGELPDAQKDGFLGFIKRGHNFDFSTLSVNLKEIVEV
ncbi:MAG: MBL fold metallo-hydrolase [Moorea sp. SIO2B7]|nr:MBL fold metallo-hydrolase [Moorena sp. SIO2B7]